MEMIDKADERLTPEKLFCYTTPETAGARYSLSASFAARSYARQKFSMSGVTNFTASGSRLSGGRIAR